MYNCILQESIRWILCCLNAFFGKREGDTRSSSALHAVVYLQSWDPVGGFFYFRFTYTGIIEPAHAAAENVASRKVQRPSIQLSSRSSSQHHFDFTNKDINSLLKQQPEASQELHQVIDLKPQQEIKRHAQTWLSTLFGECLFNQSSADQTCVYAS